MTSSEYAKLQDRLGTLEELLHEVMGKTEWDFVLGSMLETRAKLGIALDYLADIKEGLTTPEIEKALAVGREAGRRIHEGTT